MGNNFKVGDRVRTINVASLRIPKEYEGAIGSITHASLSGIHDVTYDTGKRPGPWSITEDSLVGVDSPKQRIWCGICGTYVYEGDPLPCDAHFEYDTGRIIESCGVIGRQPEEQLDMFAAQKQHHQGVTNADIAEAISKYQQSLKEYPSFPEDDFYNEYPQGVKSDGGPTSYYVIPEGSHELNDLIEHKRMNFALGNIFKACYRMGEKEGAEIEYDLNKIIFFAERLKGMLKKYGRI